MSKSPYLNQGTTAPHSIRNALHTSGLMPFAVESVDQQKKRALAQLRSKNTDLEKYIFLAWLRNTNVSLFIVLLLVNWRNTRRSYLSLNDLPNLTQIIKTYRPYPYDDTLTPQIAVITDGSRILGLGDLGVNGMGIPVGKLQLYVAAAGIDPRHEFYLGLRNFSSEHAFDLLSKYRENTFCFNDDIQGTGAVVLSGFINAVKLVEKDVHPTKHRLLFFGAGSAGVGVAKQLLEFFKVEHGMSEEEAKRLVWLVDTKGLVTLDRGDNLAKHKVYFARDDNDGNQFKTLEEVIEYVKPTALIGLSSTGGVFNEKIINRMAELNKNPIIFPLSNPKVNAECTFEDAMKGTDNRVIFASGTAFPEYTVPETGKTKYPGQGNNMYIFPGLGLGAILAKPKVITDKQIYISASALSTSLTEEEKSLELLYPVVSRIRHVSAQVAAAVIVETVEEGLARDKQIIEMVQNDIEVLKTRKGKEWDNLVKFVQENMWDPDSEKFFNTEEL
ncbi:unnamed protein product [Rhizophagus irregularis]|nr:unnamed protein product [Rhizophagus irregularis]